MGNQQFLPLVLAAIVIGFAIVRGMEMFRDEKINQAKEEIQKRLLDTATRAQAYYRRPAALGGGGHSFATISWKKINVNPNTYFASFTMSEKQPGSVKLTGTSLDDPTISVSCIVYADSVALQ